MDSADLKSSHVVIGWCIWTKELPFKMGPGRVRCMGGMLEKGNRPDGSEVKETSLFSS